ncbi:MAG TPA: AI-2E family transporter, partial [Verrucomicrobiae bacterium]|nr:AI-2E family transporter [Verrucomicrobiae bacterium]
GILGVALAGLFAFDTLGRALLPACLYFAVHLVEANAITPFILGRRLTLNPVVIFVALIFCIWLWGITGALLAMPLLVTLKVVCDRIPALAMAGEVLSGDSDRKGAS